VFKSENKQKKIVFVLKILQVTYSAINSFAVLSDFRHAYLWGNYNW